MKCRKVNIGLCISQKISELGINKSELARRIGVANQNINRLLEKESIDTDKLVSISEALNFNFFDCFSTESKTENITNSGEHAILVKGSNNKNVVTSTDTAILKERIKALEAIVAEKERLINVLMEGRK